MSPFFSIIVPVYNKERYITRCLDSVIKQTYTDFECILVDDGSTDDSNTICRGYFEASNRFLMIEKENGGLSDARNYGVKHAKGEYVLFLDADDMLHPEALERCNQEIVNSCPDIVMFKMCTTEKSAVFESEMNEVTGYLINENEWLGRLFKTETGWSVCNKAYRRTIFDEIKFPVGRLFEDQFVIVKLLGGRKISYIDLPLYFYFQDVDDSLSKRKIYSETYDYLDASIEVLKDVEELGCYTKEAANLVFRRISLLLTNTYYNEGQFRHCQIHRINQIVMKNKELILRNITGKEKALLITYMVGPNLLKRALIRMRFEPGQYIVRKIGF